MSKVYRTKVDTGSSAYQQNRSDMLALVDKLQELNQRAPNLSAKRRKRFEQRGQLLPRERLARLLDPGMPFLPIGNLAGYLWEDEDPATCNAGSTSIAGIGYIEGVRSLVFVDDSGIQAGALSSGTSFKIRRTLKIALEQKMPFVHLVESAGGNLLRYSVEGFVEFGDMFAGLARLSAAGVPTVALLHGSSTAGGAYMPGLSDYVIGVRSRGRAYLAGPPLLKAATGEIAKDEELGGAEMHSQVSGLVEYLVEDDAEACVMGRDVVSRLNWNQQLARTKRSFDEPLYDPDEIAGIVPVDYRIPYDVHEVIVRIVDGSKCLDFKPDFGVSTVCVQAEIFGMAVGLIGNNGPIDPAGANKATQFLQLCDTANVPVIFLQNTTGYIVGMQSERAGMIKHGSKMIQAVTNIEVPRITMMIGASFGAGNYGMCGRGYDPDFCFTWPNAKTGVMGGQQVARTMSQVARDMAAARGQEPDEEALAKQEEHLQSLYDYQADAFFCSGRGLDDGMIDPRDSRKVLGFLLETIYEARSRTVRPNNWGVARL